MGIGLSIMQHNFRKLVEQVLRVDSSLQASVVSIGRGSESDSLTLRILRGRWYIDVWIDGMEWVCTEFDWNGEVWCPSNVGKNVRRFSGFPGALEKPLRTNVHYKEVVTALFESRIPSASH